MTLHVERLDQARFVPTWLRNEHIARFQFAANFVREKIVIDCACGSGIGERYFAPEAKIIAAIDISLEALSTADLNSFSNVVFAAGNGERFPIRSGIADVVISFETIEHLERDELFLSEIARVLKSDGLFLCSTPNRTVHNPGTLLSDRPWNRFHTREYDREEFVSLMRRYFRTVELFGQNPAAPNLVRFSEWASLTLWKPAGAWINQISKLPRIFFDRMDRHMPKPMASEFYEYMVATCSGPR